MEYLRIWAEIDLDKALLNLKNLKEKAGEGVSISAVIKANAYGHGAVPLANTLKDHVSFFSVACVREAIDLRKAGISLPIHILGYTPPELFPYISEYNLCVTTYTSENAKALNEYARAKNKKISVFLALDTGMERIGFEDSKESLESILELAESSNLEILGIFTHFARADEKDKTSTNLQIDRFTSFIDSLEKRGLKIPFKSAYNSSGLIALDKNFNLVRPGISLYGIYPSDEVGQDRVKLYPVLSLKTRVVHLHKVSRGSGVSYGHTFIADKEMTLATLSAGYGDGVNRLLSNKGRVLINGRYAPIVGRVCMDFFMVDVSHIPNVKLEDTAIIIGKSGENEILASEVAEKTQTIPYETTCSISKRVPRLYFKDSKRVEF